MGAEVPEAGVFLLCHTVRVSNLARDLEVGFSLPTSGLWPPSPQGAPAGVVSSGSSVPRQRARESPVWGEDDFSADSSIVLH